MASCDWKKFKSKTEVKAMFRHCESEERMKRVHANKQIDKSRTYLNLSFGAFQNGYGQVSNMYDEYIDRLDALPNQNKRKDRVTCVGLEIPTPYGMDDQTARDWCKHVYKLLDKKYGKRLIGGTVHFDEVHEYRDPESKGIRKSRPHLHCYVIPEINGKLNAKKFTSRKEMIAMNNNIDELTNRRYQGYQFMTGTKKKSRKTVEQLKNESERLEDDWYFYDKLHACEFADRESKRIIRDAHVQSSNILNTSQEKSEDVLTRAEEVLTRADERAKAIIDTARRAAETKHKAILEEKEEEAGYIIAQAKKDAQASAERILGRAKREANKITLVANKDAEYKIKELEALKDKLTDVYNEFMTLREDCIQATEDAIEVASDDRARSFFNRWQVNKKPLYDKYEEEVLTPKINYSRSIIKKEPKAIVQEHAPKQTSKFNPYNPFPDLLDKMNWDEKEEDDDYEPGF